MGAVAMGASLAFSPRSHPDVITQMLKSGSSSPQAGLSVLNPVSNCCSPCHRLELLRVPGCAGAEPLVAPRGAGR
ncbi:unnamed protein product [Lota lota]